jgi:hypothetical protein
MLVGEKKRPRRRWDSWYDSTLVTRDGESILQELDAWGIETLRYHHLVWSSWGSLFEVPQPHLKLGPFGMRILRGIDPDRWRLFFASLLWRAAATSLPEFADVVLPPAELEQLRQSLFDRKPLGDEFYPVALTQLSTRGRDHVRAPFKTDMEMFDNDGNTLGKTAIFRFYFDGLTAQFRIPGGVVPLQPLGPAGVGNEAIFAVTTVSFEDSRQRSDGQANLAAALEKWPDEMRHHGF